MAVFCDIASIASSGRFQVEVDRQDRLERPTDRGRSLRLGDRGQPSLEHAPLPGLEQNFGLQRIINGARRRRQPVASDRQQGVDEVGAGLQKGLRALKSGKGGLERPREEVVVGATVLRPGEFGVSGPTGGRVPPLESDRSRQGGSRLDRVKRVAEENQPPRVSAGFVEGLANGDDQRQPLGD